MKKRYIVQAHAAPAIKEGPLSNYSGRYGYYIATPSGEVLAKRTHEPSVNDTLCATALLKAISRSIEVFIAVAPPKGVHTITIVHSDPFIAEIIERNNRYSDNTRISDEPSVVDEHAILKYWMREMRIKYGGAFKIIQGTKDDLSGVLDILSEETEPALWGKM